MSIELRMFIFSAIMLALAVIVDEIDHILNFGRFKHPYECIIYNETFFGSALLFVSAGSFIISIFLAVIHA